MYSQMKSDRPSKQVIQKLATSRRIMKWRRWIKPFVSRHGSAEDIAKGVAIGLIIAFTPTIGIQMILAITIATALKASRAAALVMVWITMPVTIVPIYVFTYTVGRLFVGGPSVAGVRHQLASMIGRIEGYEAFDISARVQVLMEVGHETFLPMMIGGLFTGIVCACVAYPVTVWGVKHIRAHREARRAKRRRRRPFPRLLNKQKTK